MPAVQIKFRKEGFYELRNRDPVQDFLKDRAQLVADAASAMDGGNYIVYSQQGKRKPQGRWRTSIETADPRTMVLNSKYNTLLKALDAAR